MGAIITALAAREPPTQEKGTEALPQTSKVRLRNKKKQATKLEETQERRSAWTKERAPRNEGRRCLFNAHRKKRRIPKKKK